MADNVDVDSGSGIEVSTDELTDGSHVQRVRSTLETVTVSQTPTVSTTPAYTIGDAIGGLLTFANAARLSGGTGTVMSVVVVDQDQELKDMDLVLFNATIAAPTDNSPFDPTNAELLTCVGHIPILASDYTNFSDNSIATKQSVGLVYTLAGTSLFGALVARGAPQFTATSDITVTLVLAVD